MNPRVSGSSAAVTAYRHPSDATSRPLTVPRLQLPAKKTRPITDFCKRLLCEDPGQLHSAFHPARRSAAGSRSRVSAVVAALPLTRAAAEGRMRRGRHPD